MSTSAGQPPFEQPPASPPGPAPSFRLYTPQHVAVAAVLGGLVGGTVLMAINDRRLGRPRDAAVILVTGIGVTIGLFALGAALPESFGAGGGIAAGLAVGLWQLAKKQQGQRIDQHVAAGGALEPMGKAIGVGVLSLAVVLGGFLAAFFGLGLDGMGPRVDFGNEQLVFYGDGATEDEARRVGEFLRETRVFDGTHAIHVKLARSGPRYELSFVIPDPALRRDPALYADFSRLRAGIEAAVLSGQPTVIYLCDDQFDPQVTVQP